MYAIVTIAGKQYKVSADQFVYVDKLPQDAGQDLKISEVLLVDNSGSIKLGQPHVSGASVSAKVLSHVKGDKVIVFKKKRRKGYKKKNGHRQQYTKIKIESIQA